jgi:phosphoglycerate dehydrogenase-like enzyme
MLAIWCNTNIPESAQSRLIAGVQPHRLILSSQQTGNLIAAGPDATLANADIAFGQPDPDQILNLPRLRWIQLSSAGYTRYDRADIRDALLRRNAIITNSSSVFDEPCAEHVLAFMLAQARAIPQSLANQFSTRAWPTPDLRPRCRLLTDQTILLLGFGAIARRLAELLQPLRMKITAIRQSPRGNEPVSTHPISELEKLLPRADHVVNILPASPATDNFINAAHFSAMKPGAIFYNIGRGTTINQKSLIQSLTTGHLAAAYLDVTEPEPLPPDHPLWRTPNCFITPHTGGGHINESERIVDHFLQNLRRFQSSEALQDQILK